MGAVKSKDLTTAAVVAVAVSLLFAPFAMMGIDLHHDGLMFKTALDVAQGKHIFTQTFSPYGAFTSWLQGAMLWAFGEELRVLKLGTVCFYGLTAGLYFLLWRKFLKLPRVLTLAALGVWCLFAYFFDADWAMLPWSSIFALLIQGLTFWACASELPVLAGVLCAVAYLFRQPVGVALFAGVLFSMTALADPGRRLRTAASVTLGFAGVLGGFLLQQSLLGAWSDWRTQNWDFPRMMGDRLGGFRQLPRKLFWDGDLGYPLLFLVPGLGYFAVKAKDWRWPGILAALLPILALELWLSATHPAWLRFIETPGGWRVLIPISLLVLSLTLVPGYFKNIQKGDRETRIVLLFTVLCLCSWSQYFPIPCKRHVLWAISPSIGLFVYWLHRTLGRSQKATLLLLAALFTPALLGDLKLAWAKIHRPYEEIREGRLRGMKVDLASRDGAYLVKVNALLLRLGREYPQTPLMLESPDALWATLVPNQDQPGPIFVHWPLLRGNAMEDPKRAEFVAKRHPWIICEQQSEEYIQWLIQKFGYRILFEVPKTDEPESRRVVLLGVLPQG